MKYAGIYPVPELPPGKLNFLKGKPGVVYVQYVKDRVYAPDKRYSVPQQRVSLGKLVDPNDRTRLYATIAYLELFPNAQPIVCPQPEKRSGVVSAGCFIAFESIVLGYGLVEMLTKHFGDHAFLLLDLCLFQIIMHDNACMHYEDYAETHVLFSPHMYIYSGASLSRVLSGITSEQIAGFLASWNAKQDRHKMIHISYDSTNKNSNSLNTTIAAYGKAKIDTGAPIINFALAFNQSNQVPLYYEVYNGSINDVSQFSVFIFKLLALGYKKINFILDRGYFSSTNIKLIDDNGYTFIMMVKGNDQLINCMIDKVYGSFERDLDCRIEGTQLFATTVESELHEGDGKIRYFHICFSPVRFMTENKELLDTIDAKEAEFKRYEGKEYEPTHTDRLYFDFLYRQEGQKNLLVSTMRKKAELAKATKYCGYFCIVSSYKISASEAYQLYYGRDSTEKQFRTMGIKLAV